MHICRGGAGQEYRLQAAGHQGPPGEGAGVRLRPQVTFMMLTVLTQARAKTPVLRFKIKMFENKICLKSFKLMSNLC